MSDMTKRQELNALIAKHFGFKESEGREYLCDGMPQWTYPRDWYLAQCSIPNVDIPDFLRILEDYLKLMKKHDLGGPREYFGKL